jgi:hypothetical protein
MRENYFREYNKRENLVSIEPLYIKYMGDKIMNIKEEVFDTFDHTVANLMDKLMSIPPDELYEFAKENISKDGMEVPDFANIAIRDKFMELEPVFGKQMEEAAREWLEQKGMDEVRREIMCHIFIMGVAVDFVKDGVIEKPILH